MRTSLDIAPGAPEDIHLPGGIEPRLPQVPQSPGSGDGAAAADFAGAFAPLIKRRSVDLGPQGRARYPASRPGLVTGKVFPVPENQSLL